MLDRLYQFSTELVSRSVLRRLLAGGLFAASLVHGSGLYADDLDDWRSSFYRGWQTIRESGRLGLPNAYRSGKELRVEAADEFTTLDAPTSRRQERRPPAAPGERAPLRLMPRDSDAVSLQEANASLVWEPQRPSTPSRKVVRSRHVEATEPSLAHDPNKVRMPALTSSAPRAVDYTHIVQTSNEVAVEMEPTESSPSPTDPVKEEQAKTIVDLMKKFGGALDGTEFDSARPFDLGDAPQSDADAKSQERLDAVREAVDSAARAKPEATPGRRRDDDVQYFVAPPTGLAKPASNEQPSPDFEPRPGEPKRLDMHVLPVPAQALPEGVINPDAAAEALRNAAEQLEHAANTLERQSLYERADQLREQAHHLRVDARGLKHPRTAVRPVGDCQEKCNQKTSATQRPGALGVADQQPAPVQTNDTSPTASASPTFLLASYEELQPSTALQRWSPRRGEDVLGLLEMVKSAAGSVAAPSAPSTEPMLTGTSQRNVSAERTALIERFQDWERATSASPAACVAFANDHSAGVVYVAPGASRTAASTLVDALDRMSDLLEGTAFEGPQHIERREEERRFRLRRGLVRSGDADFGSVWTPF